MSSSGSSPSFSPPSLTVRTLGTRSLTGLVVASMIGSGVYTTSGFLLVDLPDVTLLLMAWVVAGGIALCGAIAYGDLADELTENGGEYLYLARRVHPAAGFVAGWVSIWAGFSAAGAYAVTTFELYARPLLPPWWQLLPAGSLALGLTAAVTLLHLLGTRRGAAGQSGLVVLKLVCLAAFILIAISRPGRWNLFMTDELAPSKLAIWQAFPMALVWISFSYTGFNGAVYVAGESTGSLAVRRAMGIGTAVVAGLYVVLNAIFLWVAGPDQVVGRADIARIAAVQLGGPMLASAVAGLICLGLATTASSIVMTGPRVYARMAADGLLPRQLAHADGTPRRITIALQGVLIAAIASSSTLPQLLGYLGLTLSISSAATVATLFVGRSRRLSIAAVVYVTATVAIAIVAAVASPQQVVPSAVTLASGLLVYAGVDFLRRRSNRLTPL